MHLLHAVKRRRVEHVIMGIGKLGQEPTPKLLALSTPSAELQHMGQARLESDMKLLQSTNLQAVTNKPNRARAVMATGERGLELLNRPHALLMLNAEAHHMVQFREEFGTKRLRSMRLQRVTNRLNPECVITVIGKIGLEHFRKLLVLCTRSAEQHHTVRLKLESDMRLLR